MDMIDAITNLAREDGLLDWMHGGLSSRFAEAIRLRFRSVTGRVLCTPCTSWGLPSLRCPAGTSPRVVSYYCGHVGSTAATLIDRIATRGMIEFVPTEAGVFFDSMILSVSN